MLSWNLSSFRAGVTRQGMRVQLQVVLAQINELLLLPFSSSDQRRDWLTYLWVGFIRKPRWRSIGSSIACSDPTTSPAEEFYQQNYPIIEMPQ